MMDELKPNLIPITEGTMYNFRERRTLTLQELTQEILRLREELEDAHKLIKNVSVNLGYMEGQYGIDEINTTIKNYLLLKGL